MKKKHTLHTTAASFAATAALAATLLLAMTASAHHSFSSFNMDTEQTITGIVKQVDWTNPHIWIWIDVRNQNGELETWGMEGMSPNYLARREWTRETLQLGDEITAVIRPMKDGSNGGMFLSTTLADGTRLTMGGASR
jgi:hypothetical protein